LEGWGRFFIKIKIPLASPFEKGRNYFKSPCITVALPPFLKEGRGGFFLKIKIPLASPFEKGRNYFESPFVSLCHFPSF